MLFIGAYRYLLQMYICTRIYRRGISVMFYAKFAGILVLWDMETESLMMQQTLPGKMLSDLVLRFFLLKLCNQQHI